MRTFVSKWGNEIAYTDEPRRADELIAIGFREITENEGAKPDDTAPGRVQAGKTPAKPRKASKKAEGVKHE